MSMGLTSDYKDGQTPLSEEEREELKIKSIASHQELDEFEQQNIEAALGWLMSKSVSLELFLSEKFVKELHKKMFGSVWLWAGTFRKTNKNIGVDSKMIAVALKNLFDDCSYWLENKIFSEEEIAIRFKHRLVFIHPFPNGNGRLSRLMADVMMEKIFQKPAFPWGGVSYIKAIREADQGNFQPLITFAKSKKI